MAPSEYVTVQYNGSNSQPSIDQIQPIRINTNPLNIVVGNPNLGPSFRHNMSASYNMSQEISGKSLYISGSYGLVVNNVISKVDIDNNGRTVTQFLNLTDKSPMNYRLYAQMGRKFGIVNTSLTLQTYGNTSYSYTNNALNQSKNTTYEITGSLNLYKANKYSISVDGGPSYTFNTQSLQSFNSYNSAGANAYAYFSLYLPGKFQLSTDFQYYYQAAIKDAPAVNRPMLSAGIHKNFLKNESLKFSITGNNLFNRDQNFRGITPNGFSQTNYASIRRYFMVTLSWDFTKFGTTSTN